MIDDRTPADHEHERWKARREEAALFPLDELNDYTLKAIADGQMIARADVQEAARQKFNSRTLCSHCSIVFDKADQCGCGLCPQSCEMLCHPIYDSGSGVMRSNCGNCS